MSFSKAIATRMVRSSKSMVNVEFSFEGSKDFGNKRRAISPVRTQALTYKKDEHAEVFC